MDIVAAYTYFGNNKLIGMEGEDKFSSIGGGWDLVENTSVLVVDDTFLRASRRMSSGQSRAWKKSSSCGP